MSTFWMNAKKEGLCKECDGIILEGDRIVWDTTEYKAYCSDCGEEVAGEDPAQRSYIK